MSGYSMDLLLERLRALADERYRDFNEALTPGARGTSLGVRLPALRKIAKELLKEDPVSFLDASLDSRIHELRLLHAIVLARAKLPLSERHERLRAFVPTLDNWAVCDVLCSDWKPGEAELAPLLAIVTGYMASDREFEVRFGAVMLMLYYRNVCPDEVFRQYAGFRHDGYYAQMAVAWGISYLFVDHRERTLRFLREDTLDRFTHNKAIQKITESNRVSGADKQLLRTLRR